MKDILFSIAFYSYIYTTLLLTDFHLFFIKYTHPKFNELTQIIVNCIQAISLILLIVLSINTNSSVLTMIGKILIFLGLLIFSIFGIN